MKFLVIELQETADGTVTYIVTVHEEREEAESKFHAILQFAAISHMRRHSAVIMTPDGFTQKKDGYEYIEPEPEPEPEPTPEPEEE